MLYLMFFKCPKCGHRWQDDGEIMCDEPCPECGRKYVEPEDYRVIDGANDGEDD